MTLYSLRHHNRTHTNKHLKCDGWNSTSIRFVCVFQVSSGLSHFLTFLSLLTVRYAVSTQWERQVVEGREPRDFHSLFCCGARRIGHMFALISASDGTPIVISGPCWPFCLFVTFPLIIGLSCLVIFFLILGETFSLVSKNLVLVVLFPYNELTCKFYF